MHRCAHRQDDVAHVAGDAGVVGRFHVGRDGRNGGAGAESRHSRGEQVLEHDLGRARAAAEAGVYRGGDKHIYKAHDVVDDKRAAVIADEGGAVACDEVCEEAEEADRRIVGDDLDGLHDAVGDVLKQLRGLGRGAAGHLYAEAEDYRRDDQGQDSSAAEQLREVGLGEEVDYHISHAECRADLALSDDVSALNEREYTHDYVHQHCRDSCRDGKDRDRDAENLARALRAAHVRDGGGDGAEHHRHHDAEHHVYEHRAQRLKSGRSRPYRADDAAGDDADEHGDYEPIALEEGF